MGVLDSVGTAALVAVAILLAAFVVFLLIKDRRRHVRELERQFQAQFDFKSLIKEAENARVGREEKTRPNGINGQLHDQELTSIPEEQKVTLAAAGASLPSDVVEVMKRTAEEMSGRKSEKGPSGGSGKLGSASRKKGGKRVFLPPPRKFVATSHPPSTSPPPRMQQTSSPPLDSIQEGTSSTAGIARALRTAGMAAQRAATPSRRRRRDGASSSQASSKGGTVLPSPGDEDYLPQRQEDHDHSAVLIINGGAALTKSFFSTAPTIAPTIVPRRDITSNMQETSAEQRGRLSASPRSRSPVRKQERSRSLQRRCQTPKKSSGGNFSPRARTSNSARSRSSSLIPRFLLTSRSVAAGHDPHSSLAHAKQKALERGLLSVSLSSRSGPPDEGGSGGSVPSSSQTEAHSSGSSKSVEVVVSAANLLASSGTSGLEKRPTTPVTVAQENGFVYYGNGGASWNGGSSDSGEDAEIVLQERRGREEDLG